MSNYSVSYQVYPESFEQEPISADKQFKRQVSITFGSEAFMILGAIELNSWENARDLALSASFMNNNKTFVNSGELLRICMEKGYTSFARDLIEAGYFLPKDILIQAIKFKQIEAIQNIINEHLYPKDGIELEYWYLLHKKFPNFAESLREKEEVLQAFQIDEHEYDNDPAILAAALKISLERGFDEFACIIVKQNQTIIDADMIETALENKNIEFLRRIWTGDLRDNHAFYRIKRLKISTIWQQLNSNTNFEKKVEVSKLMNISYIIKSLLQRKLILEARKVLTWPEAADDKDVINVCVEMHEEDLGRDIIAKRTRPATRKDFEHCFDNGCYWLAMDMLKWDDPVTFLVTTRAQAKIVELLSNGATCYFAAEFLSRIKALMWDSSLTERVCYFIDLHLKKDNELNKCPHPILFLVLLSEFLLNIAPVNIYHTILCKRKAEDLITLAKTIEDNIDEERELEYFLNSSDSQGRSVLLIISLNNFYSLLENNDAGSIIHNLWIGDRKNEGILKASTLFSSATAPEGSDEKLGFFNPIDSGRAFLFQYEQLISSCKLRFYGQIISIAFLVLFYSVMVELAHEENTQNDFAAGKNTQAFLRLSQIWISGIFLEKLITLLFFVLTKRQIFVDSWLIIDTLMFIMMIFLMAGVNEYYAGDSKWLSFISSSDFNALMHSAVLCLVWLKLFNILMITESYGPLLKLLYMITVNMVAFLLVYFGVLFLGAAILTTLFSGSTSNGNYLNFSRSLQAMYSMGLGTFDLAIFKEYEGFGGIVLAILVVITNVLLINVLIAILSVTYEKEVDGQEAKYRATLIKAYSRWRWDENYGLLILMPSPITIIISTVVPALLCLKNASKITNLFSKICFILFVLPMFLYFACVSAIYIPIIYIKSLEPFAKGGIRRVKQQLILKELNETDSDSNDEESESDLNSVIDLDEIGKYKVFSIRRAIIWILTGSIITIFAYLRDLLYFWLIIFRTTKKSRTLTEDLESSILSSPNFINNLRDSLNKISQNEISLDQLVETLIEIDKKDLSTILISDKNLMERRKTSAEAYCSNLCFSKKNKTINKNDILDILPFKNYYSQNCVLRAKQIRIDLISKALKVFRKNISKISIEGIEISKNILINETFQVKRINNSSKNTKIRLNIVENIFNRIQEQLDNISITKHQIY